MAELEKGTQGKLVWFLCPTVTLVKQQYKTISTQIRSFQSRPLSGNDGIDRWSEQSFWDDALRNMDIIVCTHQVLLDALIHGFVRMVEIALLVFDEAHHCTQSHPANKIMQNFYHPMRREGRQDIPHILGLTASPVVRTKGEGLQTIESNLNAISKTPRLNREELGQFVHRPEMIVMIHDGEQSQPSRLLQDTSRLYLNLDSDRDREVVSTRKTCSQDQMKRLVRIATEVNRELGSWTSDLFICLCINKFLARQGAARNILEGVSERQKTHLEHIFTTLQIPSVDIHLSSPGRAFSRKVQQLISLLANEISPGFAGIVFVKTRATVKLLSLLLKTQPVLKGILQIGTFVGESNNLARSSNISDLIDIREQKDTLDDLRRGKKNLIIATSVCEEGIDIAVCNLVLCFEPPPNLKSFIQRRGRARSAKSRFVIMFPEGEEKLLLEWQRLEAAMKEKYMDDMRHVENLKKAEAREEGHRELAVNSTGAKITLRDALQHLYHFCNTLPPIPYTVFAPIFTFDHKASGTISCRVLLPNTVHSSVREFCSTGLWSTERWARMDAAFEAYVGLYHAGLVNDNLLPSPTYDGDAAKAYSKVAKRDSIVEVDAKYDPWPIVAAAWQSTSTIYHSTVKILSGATQVMRMKLIAPCCLPPISSFRLYLDKQTTLWVHIDEGVERARERFDDALANKVTKVILTSVFANRMEGDGGGFPLLFMPDGDADKMEDWLEKAQGTHDVKHLLSGLEDVSEIGIIRDLSRSGKRYAFRGVERLIPNISPQRELEDKVEWRLKGTIFSKRTDFLHRIPLDAKEKQDDIVSIDPTQCEIYCLPQTYSQFAMYVPSIMHHVENILLTEHLRKGVLAPVGFSNYEMLFPAICTPAAAENDDYQRLEFLGDSVLKILTSTTLMADHPTWHEGYLSRAKDHVVSNTRLAMAACETSLDQYILTKSFTGKKWRPLNNARLRARSVKAKRAISTKTLADVVEALLGAAFLDGGFAKALCCLRIFLPETSWLSLPELNTMLQDVYNLPQISIPSNFGILESLVGHQFTCPRLLLEAVTHPSHLSVPRTPSYQRLEYLGDAILDYLVTTTVFSQKGLAQRSLRPRDMHTIRATAVNASFLAFCCLSQSFSLPIAESLPVHANRTPSFTSGERIVSLPAFLRHAPIASLTSALSATHTRFAALRSALDATFAQDHTYPWRALAALAPEKVFSDMVEAILGALYIDTSGDFELCRGFLRKLGILRWVEIALKTETVLLHPKQQLNVLIGNKKIRYEVQIQESDEECISSSSRPTIFEEGELTYKRGKYRCKLLIDENEVCNVQGWNRQEVEVAAAEEVSQTLGVEFLHTAIAA